MTIMLPRSAKEVSRDARIAIVPPAEVWEPAEASVNKGARHVGRTAYGQNVRTLSASHRSSLEMFEQRGGGIDSQRVRTQRKFASEDIQAKGRVLVSAAERSSHRIDRIQNLVAGSIFGLLLAAGIALFTPTPEMNAPVPDTVVPNVAATQALH